MRGTTRGALQRACFVGNHTPRQCGIATFTADVSEAVRIAGVPTDIVAINDHNKGYDYPNSVAYQIPERKVAAYRSAADYLNLNDYSVACLQHEYGIFGGAAGSHVLQLLRNLRMPLVTTLHTLLESPSADQKSVLEEIVQLSQRVVVMSKRAKAILQAQFNVQSTRIDLIPHGTPEVEFVCPDVIKPKLGYQGRRVLLTFGLLSPDKGIEYVLQALPALAEQHPDLLYVVLGSTHPQVRAQTNDAYRKSLLKLAQDLGVQEHVHFEDRFVELDELVTYLQAADIYITPYLKEQQITSGTLSYAFGCGKPIVSTPYWHAEELLDDGKGILVPFRDSQSIEMAVGTLLNDAGKLESMATRAYALSRAMTWPNIGQLYVESFERAIREGKSELRSIYTPPKTSTIEQPRIDLRHLTKLTDNTGIFQHAFGPIPNRNEGYCVDDNGRALLVCARLSRLGIKSPALDDLASIYLSFLHHSWNDEKGRFRNFMSYDRRWLEEAGSEDSHARAVWGLGEWVASSVPTEIRKMALFILEKALAVVPTFTSPRAWAYTMIGLCKDTSPLTGESVSRHLLWELGDRLRTLYRRSSTTDWRWFEGCASYDNARLSQSMLLAGRTLDEPEFIQIGLESLEWLCSHEIDQEGFYAPIGCNEVWQHGAPRPRYDQQPLEAWGMVDACLEAATSGDSAKWVERARMALDWFWGRNILQSPVVDSRTGGCRDGLHQDRLNDNQGAESTLAYLGATAHYLDFVQAENWNFVGVAK